MSIEGYLRSVEEAELGQVRAAQAKAAESRPDLVPRRALELIAAGPRSNVGERIARLASEYSSVLNDPACDPRIIAKVARAVVEGRLPEGQVSGVIACLGHARCRGAYFVAAAKKLFLRNELDWYEENWQ